jgi:(p)ppGpp synthase/HD superfamily hydrolase
LRVCIEAHTGQVRKGGDCLPYAVHPLQVGLLLARLGHEDEVVQAGLLHDVVEDCPGWSLERVEREFGARVAAIVGELTEDKSKSWEERKLDGIARVAGMSPQAACVKAGDKLHNLESLLAELRANSDHPAVWKRFRGGRERSLFLSHELVEALAARIDAKLARALRSALKQVVQAGEAAEDLRAGRPA